MGTEGHQVQRINDSAFKYGLNDFIKCTRTDKLSKLVLITDGKNNSIPCFLKKVIGPEFQSFQNVKLFGVNSFESVFSKFYCLLKSSEVKK